MEHMERIGIRELRQHASRWIKRVEQGESFEVTDRGRPVAVLAPVPSSESPVERMLRSGVLRAPTSLRRPRRRIRATQGPSASEVLAELRREDA
ncbi:MAG TPA: type II toxin-antitoxin system prevent-host-death family antitoxin [Nocardioidaceae bacterium]|jgi:prevent-host-death family protein